MRLLLIGCTGLVGRALVPMLQTAGHDLTIVSRRSAPAGLPASCLAGLSWVQCNPADSISWAPSSPLQQALAQAQGVVNLAGEPIAEKRWTSTHLQLLEDSRLKTTRQLVKAMADLAQPPDVLINASAVGYYGTSADECFEESSPCGNDVLAGLCQRWEAVAAEKPDATRLVVLRIGIVLAADGGALGKMLPIFRIGFGGPIGTGRQWMSWIERSDLCRMILAAVENDAWTGGCECRRSNTGHDGHVLGQPGSLLGASQPAACPRTTLESVAWRWSAGGAGRTAGPVSASSSVGFQLSFF